MVRNGIVVAMALLSSGGGIALLAQDSSHPSGGSPRVPAAHDSSPRPRTYSQVMKALTGGENVAVTVRFNQCTVVGTGGGGPAVTGGLHINAFQIPPDRSIAFSDVHETLNAQNQKVTEYIRYRVAPDGAVTIRTTALTADGKVSNEAGYRCAIGKGAEFNWSGD